MVAILKRAMSLIDDVFKGVKDDPTAHEIRAAALANMGDYIGAMASEHRRRSRRPNGSGGI